METPKKKSRLKIITAVVALVGSMVTASLGIRELVRPGKEDTTSPRVQVAVTPEIQVEPPVVNVNNVFHQTPAPQPPLTVYQPAAANDAANKTTQAIPPTKTPTIDPAVDLSEPKEQEVAPLPRSSSFPLGREELIEITSDLPRVNGYYFYDFDQPISQGERLHVSVRAVNAAEIKTQIVVSTSEPRKPRGKRFEASKIAPSQDWTMQKKPPGDVLHVRIRANALGLLKVRVDKVTR